jgi:ParB/RepB/Spo0J family partition protein
MTKDVPLEQIDEPKGMLRMEIDSEAIGDLAQSISEIGLLQNILLAVDGDRYEIVFGHRRYLAHKTLGLTSIKAIVRTMTQEEIGVARATENISRADLTPIEEAATYLNLIENYGMAIEHVAKKMGRKVGTIKRRMDLLKMPPQLQKAVHAKSISMSVAEELWTIADMGELDYYLSFAVDGGCTRDVARTWAKEWKDKKRRSENPGEGGDQSFAPTEPRPVYVTCDLCVGPMELGKENILRVCKDCMKTIKQNM